MENWTDGSEIWFTWNPRRKSDAVDEFLRSQNPDNAIIVKANFSDNPFFPAVLVEEMQLDREWYPDRFEEYEDGTTDVFGGA